MKRSRIEIRIEEHKKEQLIALAKQNDLDISKLLNIIIDKILYNTNDINILSNRKNNIVRHMMNINDIASQMHGELAKQLLKELGELECQI